MKLLLGIVVGYAIAYLIVWGLLERRKWKARALEAEETLERAWREFDRRHEIAARAIRRATGVSRSRGAHPEHAAEMIDLLLEEAGTQL